ncbi:MAG TPA: hypothetical protein VJC11_03305 [Patescibacteria group bacterium]|nr:hypothetical protein [Patescibacteria group bacterium]
MKILDPRAVQILFAVVEEYIATAVPVGSLELAQKYRIDASSATIRNDMARLEDEGFLEQPYTSAGRVPTDKAYRLYLEQCSSEPSVLSNHAVRKLTAMIDQFKRHQQFSDQEIFLKSVAKEVAEMTKDLVVVEFEPNDVFYTGLAHLLEQPEFEYIQAVTPIGRMIDEVDEMVTQLRRLCREDVEILIGNQNPIDRHFSVIVGRYRIGSAARGIFGLIGPTRMPYERNIALVRFIQDQLSRIA